jgi:beta-mannanase
MSKMKLRLLYLYLAHEMNGDWYSWSLNSTPHDYVLSWHHIHNIISNKSLDSTRLQWIWCVNNADVGNYTAEDYWVGENYVDWLGIDGYNFGKSEKWSTWTWPIHVYPHMIARLRNLSSTKPLAINEYGTTSIHGANISDVQLKTEWLNQFCDYINNNQIKMASYFNKEKETDWAIFGGMHGDVVWNNFNAYSAYKDCLKSNDWIQPNSTNQRLITDEQFAGRF